MLDARERAPRRIPILLKIGCDIGPDALDTLIDVARKERIDGLIVSNTTSARAPSLQAPQAQEAGGLSGRPLFAAATRALGAAFLRVEGQFPLVGVGGIEDAATAFAKIEAGATLLQLYSALAFKGPALIGEIKAGLIARLGPSNLAAVRGRAAADWAAGRNPAIASN